VADATFVSRLGALGRERGRFCLGLDPSAATLKHWGLPVSAEGVRELGRRVLDGVGEVLGVIKPQSAYFEQFGAAGVEVLAELIAEAHEQGLLVILDGKRGDIDSTTEAYGRALIGPGSALGADATTVHAYLGLDGLRTMVDRAVDVGATLFVVVRSSNAGAWPLQDAQVRPGITVVDMLRDQIRETNTERAPATPLGAVVGATYSRLDAEWLAGFGGAPLLAPGVGAQGATWDDIRARFAGVLADVIPSASRSLLREGPDPASFSRAVRAAAEQSRELLAET
jgi:orotidine-5'-phosphate decarboxylase